MRSQKVWRAGVGGGLLCVVLLCIACIGGCLFYKGDGEGTKENQKQMQEEDSENKVYPFMDVSWVREAEGDTETLYLAADGSFHYSCACGNPVNDSDLCEGYTYDDATKTIRLRCMEVTESMVTRIIIKNYNENSMELDFDGEIRTFEKQEEEE